MSYGARFVAYGERRYVTLGHSSRGWTRRRAETELANILADVRRGAWRTSEEVEAERRAAAPAPRFGTFSKEWLEGRRLDRLRPTTLADLEWKLGHLCKHFGRLRLDEIDVAAVDGFRRRKVAEGRLGATSINGLLAALASVLEVAVEHGHLASNPARGRRRRLPSVTPSRPWLEPLQIAALLDAAGELDVEDRTGRRYRRPLLATLAWAGLRVGELLALRWVEVDLAACTLTIRAGKTAASAATIDLQPELREDLIEWKAITRHGGAHDLVFPTATGRPGNRGAVRQRVLLRAVERARERGAELPEGLSPHALRRSFASWLLAETGDVAYVQQQMRHRDPTMTLAVYARALASKPRRQHVRREGLALAMPDEPRAGGQPSRSAGAAT